VIQRIANAGSSLTEYVYDVIARNSDIATLEAHSEYIQEILRSCDNALSEMEEMSRHEVWVPGSAWDGWISILCDTLMRHGLPTTVRKDVDDLPRFFGPPLA
jgi:hypothetical protein